MSTCTVFKPNAGITRVTTRDISSFDPKNGSFEDFLVDVKKRAEEFYGKTNISGALFADDEFKQIVNETVASQKLKVNPNFTDINPDTVVAMVDKINKKSYATISKKFTVNNNDFSELFFKSNPAYNYMQNSFMDNVLKASFINKEEGVIITENSDLNKFITQYKNSLFQILKDYVGEKSKEPLYGENFEVNEDLYRAVFNAVDNSNLDETNLDVNPLNLLEVNSKLDPYNAAIILTNFDSLLNKLFKGIVNTEFVYKGYLENGGNKEKYSLTNSTIQSLFWGTDDDSSKDSSIYSSSLMKMVSTTIPLIDNNGKIIPGQYLGMNNIYKLAAIIKKGEIENMISMKENFEPFITNPKRMLEHYLKNSPSDLLKNNQQIVDSLYKYLYDNTPVNGKPNKSLSLIQDEFISKKNKGNGNLTNNIDLIGLFAFELMKNVAPEYRSYGINEMKTINLYAQDEVTGGVKSLIGLTIRANLSGGENNPFDTKSLKIKGVETSLSDIKSLTSEDIDSVEFTQYFKAITGLTLTKEIKDRINTRGKNEYTRVIKSLTESTLQIYDSVKNKYDLNQIGEIDTIIDELSKKDTYIVFSQNYIKNQPKLATTVFTNAKGASIPVYRLSSMIFNDSYFLNNYGHNDNFIASNLGLFTGINNSKYNSTTGLRLEGNDIKGSDFTVEESLYASFYGDFIQSGVTNNIFGSQIAAYSDKGSILLKMFNLKAPLNISSDIKKLNPNFSIEEKTLGTLSNDTILAMHYDTQSKYYTRLVNTALTEWGKLIPEVVKVKTVDDKINEVNKFLKGKTQESIYKEVLKQKQNGIDVVIVNEFHYSNYGGLEFNRNLKYNLDKLKSFDSYKENYKKEQFAFVQKLGNLDTKGMFSMDNFDITNDKSVDAIKNLLTSADYNKTQKFIEKKAKLNIISTTEKGITTYHNDFKTASINNFELNPLMDRYLIMTNLVRDAYLGLTVKHQYLHKVKGNYNPEFKPGMTIAEKRTLTNDMLKQEDSDRVQAMSKRMNIFPATLENYTQGLLNGVPLKYKTAVIKDSQLPTFNFSGSQTKLGKDGQTVYNGQDIHDGATFSNPLMSRLEDNSLPGKGYQGTKKTIGMVSENGYSVQFKHAQFPMTNTLIRDSHGSTFSYDTMMKKMNNLEWKENNKFLDLDISKNFKGGNFNIENANKDSLFYQDGNKYYKILSIKRSAWDENIGGTYAINKIQVDKFGVVIPRTSFTESKVIHSNYDLWKALGGEYSMEVKNSKLIDSEHSLDATVEYINNVGKDLNPEKIAPKNRVYNTTTVSQPLKDYMIALISNESAVKNGAFNVNPSYIIENSNEDQLIYHTIDSINFGVQLDSNHESDYSQLTEMSQVITALASNGHTMLEANEAYDEIANIIKQSMEKTSNFVNGKNVTELYKMMSVRMVDILRNADKISLAQGITDHVQQQVKQGFEAMLPFSNSNFFGLFTADVISSLNRSTLKRKYTGIGGTLNPSAKIVMVYEDNKGTRMLWSDLLRKATDHLTLPPTTDYLVKLHGINDSVLTHGLDGQPYDKNKELVQAYLGEHFKNEDITKDNVKLFDTILVNGVEKTLLTPKDLQDFVDFTKPKDVIQKIFSKTRDLKPVEITWVEKGLNKNIWTSDAVRFATRIREAANEPMLNSYLDYLGVKKSSVPLEQIAKRWVQRTFEALHNGYNYKPISEFVIKDEKTGNITGYDFNSYFGGDRLNGPLETGYEFKSENGVNTNTNFYKIDGPVLFKEAEASLAKVHKTVFDLQDDSMDYIRTKGLDYFKEKLDVNYSTPIEGLDLFFRTNTGNIGMRIGQFEDYNITSNGQILIGEKVNPIIDTDNETGKTYRVNNNGEKLYELPEDVSIYKYLVNGNYTEVMYLLPLVAKLNKVVNTKLALDVKGKKTNVASQEVAAGDENTIINSHALNNLETIAKSIKNNINSAVIFGTNVTEPRDLSRLLSIGLKYNSLPIYKDLYSGLISNNEEPAILKQILSNEYESKDKYLNPIATAIFSSWEKSHDVLSARIPSQAFQSFMGMNNVAYAPGEFNNTYVSHWQLWLQGSDLDIDKSFIMMYGINNNGLYSHWSPLVDYTSKESLNLSEKLPSPTGKSISLTPSDQLTDVQLATATDVSQYMLKDSLANSIDLLKIANKGNLFYSVHPDKFGIVDKINLHNLTPLGEDSSKNKIVSNIRTIINDLRNQVSAYSPVEMQEFTNQLKNIKLVDPIKSLYDGLSLFQIQLDNQVGKATVGIMANGIKAFFSLTSYLNNKYDNGSIPTKSDNYFFSKTFNFDGKEYNTSVIGDTRLQGHQVDILTHYINQINGTEGKKLYQNNSDVSLLLSALVSLATDNAKELALSKLNAGIEMASMHVYLTSLGIPPETVAKYMTSGVPSDVAQSLKRNAFTGKEVKLVQQITELTKGEMGPEQKQFVSIYQGAQELKQFTNLLKINGGVKNDIYTIHDYLESMKDGFYTSEKNVIGKVGSEESVAKKIETDNKNIANGIVIPPEKLTKSYFEQIKDRVKEKNPYLQGEDMNSYLDNVLSEAKANNLVNGVLDFDKYFSDDDTYRNSVANYYNLFKNTFNYFDTINSLPNFYNMLKSLNTVHNELKLLSAKYKFATETAPNSIEENHGLLTNFDELLNRTSGDRIKYKSDHMKKMISLYDDKVISEFFKSSNSDAYVFNIADLSNLLKEKIQFVSGPATNKTKTANNKLIDFKNIDSIASFKYIMDNYMIPKLLKVNYQGNSFVDFLIKTEDKQTKNNLGQQLKTFYKLGFNMNLMKDPTQLSLYYDVLNGFDKVSKLESGLKNVNGKDLKWGDLLYMYNLVVNKDKFGPDRLTKVFENYVLNDDSIGFKLSQFYADYDRADTDPKKKIIDIPPTDILFNLYNVNGEISLRTELGSNVRKDGSARLTNPDYTFPVDIMTTTLQNSDSVTKIIQYLKNNGFMLNLNC